MIWGLEFRGVLFRSHLAGLEENWQREKSLVEKILDHRQRLRAGAAPVEGTGSSLEKAAAEKAPPAVPAAAAESTPEPPKPLSEAERAQVLADLRALQTELALLEGENPLILPSVDGQAVASVVADWTGIPVGRMVQDEIKTVMRLADLLEARVIGQRHAHEMIARRVQTSRANLANPTRPIGVFMLAGPSGVGKTETALTLAEALYGEHEDADGTGG